MRIATVLLLIDNKVIVSWHASQRSRFFARSLPLSFPLYEITCSSLLRKSLYLSEGTNSSLYFWISSSLSSATSSSTGVGVRLIFRVGVILVVINWDASVSSLASEPDFVSGDQSSITIIGGWPVSSLTSWPCVHLRLCRTLVIHLLATSDKLHGFKTGLLSEEISSSDELASWLDVLSRTSKILLSKRRKPFGENRRPGIPVLMISLMTTLGFWATLFSRATEGRNPGLSALLSIFIVISFGGSLVLSDFKAAFGFLAFLFFLPFWILFFSFTAMSTLSSFFVDFVFVLGERWFAFA